MIIFRVLAVLMLVLTISTPALAGMMTDAKQAIILDYETGQVLLEKEADAKMPTSSMSKVMTAYMVFDALKKGRVRLDTEYKVSDKAWKKGGSKMFVPQGGAVSVEDLLRGVIIQSGNDATIVLAEGLEGSEDVFARKMTAKARELGMKNSNFKNASGWPDPEHYSTANDLALLSRHMIESFPEYYSFYGEKEFTYNEIRQENRNPLLYKDIGADGLKTGHTEAAGYGLMGTAKRDGRRVLMVVNGLDSKIARSQESVRLMEWALNNFENKKLLKKGDVMTKAEVAMGKQKELPLVVTEDVFLTVPKGMLDDFKVNARYKAPLMAPIKSGDKIGVLEISIPDMKTFEYPLYAGANVEELGFFGAAIEKIKFFIIEKIS
jgi:D-alanyl-D-alanine carboxypeptidase (penicillin-binding protein 5/6)